jgi:hypothetical protein
MGAKRRLPAAPPSERLLVMSRSGFVAARRLERVEKGALSELLQGKNDPR